jgi:hypothetical protein
MILNLDQNEISFILQVLGELPSKTGAFVLMSKISQQVEQSAAPSNQEPVEGELV